MGNASIAWSHTFPHLQEHGGRIEDNGATLGSRAGSVAGTDIVEENLADIYHPCKPAHFFWAQSQANVPAGGGVASGQPAFIASPTSAPTQEWLRAASEIHQSIVSQK